MSSSDYHGGDADVVYSKYDSKRLPDALYFQTFIMRFVGAIPIKFDQYLPPSLKRLGQNIGKCYSGFCVITSLHMAILFLKTTYDMLQSGELQQITDALTMSIIFSFAAFGTSYWLWWSKKLTAFIADINQGYEHHSMAGITFVSAKSSIVLAHKISQYWLCSCVLGVSTWGLAPILMRSRTLPLKCWYPLDPMQPGVFEFLYSTQLWCQLLMGCTFGNGSAIFVSIVIIMLGQFDVLYCSLKNLDYHAQIILGKNLNELRLIQKNLPDKADDELNQYAYSSEQLTDLATLAVTNIKPRATLQEALHESLIECVHMHQFILKCCDTLEELFNPYCIIKSLQITFQLCLLAFVGVVGERTVVSIISLIQYLALTILELLMFTYCGELLRTHSVRAGEAFWRSQWFVSGHLIKRDVLIFLINSKRVVKVTAGKFYVMDIQRLRSVITQAFSFLTLLQNLAEKGK